MVGGGPMGRASQKSGIAYGGWKNVLVFSTNSDEHFFSYHNFWRLTGCGAGQIVPGGTKITFGETGLEDKSNIIQIQVAQNRVGEAIIIDDFEIDLFVPYQPIAHVNVGSPFGTPLAQ